MSKYARFPIGKYKATAHVVCQKCLKHGHYIFECKNERPDVSQSSGTQLLDPHSMSHSKLKTDGRETMEKIKMRRVQRMREKEERVSKKRRETHSVAFTIRGWREASPFRFGNKSLFQSLNFYNILDNIRRHLLCPSLAQATYVAMARRFYDTLSDPSFNPPTNKDFELYILQKWPLLDWFDNSTTDPIVWGCVSKEEGSPNQINILSSIVLAAESPSRNMEIPYNLIITVVLLHELSHSFTKDYFCQTITPLGVGFQENSRYGESGFLVEDAIVGGRLSVEWDNREDFADMNKISRVVVKKDSECWPVDVHDANKFLFLSNR